ncbi:hypothetical protein RJ640_014372 [Escallonia rubra]|uniref:Uncharacterized protein n=1 Tax=Escallonia rubra TaxID=112253 RepID=A0AA88U5U9_9ASTE|nr:hypothetical protein RJ640_014372 [Escallonia rubra]
MEGLIPLVYRAIMQHKNGGQGLFLRSLMNESPSASYVRLPGDSGRFQASEIPMFRPDRGFSTCTSPSSGTKRVVSGGDYRPMMMMDSIELEIHDSRESQVQSALLLPLFYQYRLDIKHTAPSLDQSSPMSSSHQKSRLD